MISLKYTDYPAYIQDLPVLNFVTADRVETGNEDHEQEMLERTHDMKRTIPILLLIASFAVATGQLSAQPAPPGSPAGGRVMHGGAGRPAARGFHRQQMMEKLNLTDAQKKQLDGMRTAMQKEAVQLRSRVQLARIDLRELVRADEPVRSAIEKKLNEIASIQTEQKMLRINHWFDVKKVLTPEQQKIWKEEIRGMMMERTTGFGHRRGMMGELGRGFSDAPPDGPQGDD